MSLFTDLHQIAVSLVELVVEVKTLNATAGGIAADVKKVAAAFADEAVTGIAIEPGKPTTHVQ